MFFALQVDRGNLSQAVSDNMLDQLHLTTNGKYLFRLISPLLGVYSTFQSIDDRLLKNAYANI